MWSGATKLSMLVLGKKPAHYIVILGPCLLSGVSFELWRAEYLPKIMRPKSDEARTRYESDLSGTVVWRPC
jgi:hypothetical protein